MGVQVAACLGMYEAENILIGHEFDLRFGIEVRLISVGIEEPIVVGILVMVAGYLLLSRSLGIGLYVGVEKAATVAHVLQSRSGTICNFKRTIFANSRTSEICLEEGTHLSISRSTVLEYQEVDVEREHVDHQWNDDQTNDPSEKVL